MKDKRECVYEKEPLFDTIIDACAICRLLNQQKDAAPEVKYTSYVDPWIGTGGHGHVFLGASVPWGMVQLGPTKITL